MKTIGGWVFAAIVLAALGAAALAAARVEHRIARAEEAFASFDLAGSARAYDELQQSLAYVRFIPWIGSDAVRRMQASRAAVEYWDGDYSALQALARGETAGENPDPELLFIAANATYRLGQQRAANRDSMLRAIDDARAAYQVVLTESGGHADAAFNYEYLLGLRDEIARARLPGASRVQPPGEEGAGQGQQTLHGREGAPPPERSQKEFKVYVPEDGDERTNETEPGSDQVRQRKG